MSLKEARSIPRSEHRKPIRLIDIFNSNPDIHIIVFFRDGFVPLNTKRFQTGSGEIYSFYPNPTIPSPIESKRPIKVNHSTPLHKTVFIYNRKREDPNTEPVWIAYSADKQIISQGTEHIHKILRKFPLNQT